MAITTNFDEIKKLFKPQYWESIDEFEEYWLRSISERQSDTNYYTDRNGIEITINPINHFPELKEYEVWMEGYCATGESSDAHLVGKVKARNFGQACHILMCNKYLKYTNEINNPNYKQYTTPGRWDYNPHNLSEWNCSLYWSEKLARKTFG